MSSHAANWHARGVTLLGAAVTAVAIAGCGTTAHPPRSVPTIGPRTAAAPALLRRAPGPGEIVLDGEASPATHGPYDLHGRYLVRFAQYAPEDPRLDFTRQTAFVAAVRPAGASGTRGIRLFRAAARMGRREIDLDGRYVVDVTFGDFPYVLRFTPTRSRHRYTHS